jgi:hypothetical protein
VTEINSEIVGKRKTINSMGNLSGHEKYATTKIAKKPKS